MLILNKHIYVQYLTNVQYLLAPYKNKITFKICYCLRKFIALLTSVEVEANTSLLRIYQPDLFQLTVKILKNISQMQNDFFLITICLYQVYQFDLSISVLSISMISKKDRKTPALIRCRYKHDTTDRIIFSIQFICKAKLTCYI